MKLKQSCVDSLYQLIDAIEQLSPEDYHKPLDLLSESSIGMHTRHIIEFFDCLLKGLPSGIINYDERERNILLESDKFYAVEFIQDCNRKILEISENNQKAFSLVFSLNKNEHAQIDTTIDRELAYNIEHTIHHLAIIKIALKQYFPEVQIPKEFGVAYATLINRELQSAEK